MKLSSWNKIAVAGIIASVFSVIGFNYIVDPYEVFHSNYFRSGPPMNERFNKVEYLLKNGAKYNTLIMGSSVMGAYDPRWIESLDSTRKVYNASFLGGLPIDAQKLLKLLKEKNIKIEKIYMGIDLFPFLQVEDSKSPSKQHHYLITGENEMTFYANYMFASSAFHGWTKVNDSFKETQFINFDIEKSGRYYLLKQDDERKKDLNGYVKRHFGGKKILDVKATEVAWVNSRFEEFESFVKWTKENNIDADFYIHPFHRLLRDNLPVTAMSEFRERIFKITGKIPDFTDAREFTDDDSLYYDPKHYVDAVAKNIVNNTYRIKS
jgi:hypothetical protein